MQTDFPLNGAPERNNLGGLISSAYCVFKRQDEPRIAFKYV